MIFDNNFYIKNCWINVYKPSGVTSSFCTVKLRNLLTKAFKKDDILGPKEKLSCGHLGTLDPMAEGILPIAVGIASKTIHIHEHKKKEYVFTVNWGKTTDSDDAFGKVVDECAKVPTDNEICNIITCFIGEVEQRPNRFSAIHINGTRAYKLAHSGQIFTLPSRKITIDKLNLIKSWRVEDQNIVKHYSEFRVVCSTGTYVRTLAHDIADKLNTCGHLTKLIRLSNGVFDLRDCVNYQKLLDFLNAFLHTESDESLYTFVYKGVRFLDFLKSVDYKLDDIPVIFIEETYIFNKFMNGCVSDFSGIDGFYRVYLNLNTSDNKRFIGFAEIKDGKMYPKKVFNILKKD